MKRNSKIILATTATALTVTLGGLWFVGDYFVSYALGRKSDDVHDPLSPTYTQSQQESASRISAAEKVEHWMESSPYEEHTIISDDGLSMWGRTHAAKDPSNLWVIAVHGYTANHTNMQDVGYEYWEKGYNVLTPDLRAHGNSEGDYIGMGYFDSQDMLLWIDFILAQNPNAEIVLHGESMGAATVMSTAGQETLPENVIAVVEDCGYSSAYEMMAEQLDFRFGLPPFPIVNAARAVGIVKADYDLKDASPIEALKNATIPVLFIHGSTDTYVPPYMLDELYESYNGQKERLLIEGAGHCAARFLAPEVYYETVFGFLDSTL